jgi:hypothetical protein
MNQNQIISIQERIGAEPDGFWGPNSIAMCQKHLRDLMPSPHPWPKSDQSSLTAFYGSAGDESQLVNLPAPVPMFYEGTKIKTIRVHRKCADSLARALTAAFLVAPEGARMRRRSGPSNALRCDCSTKIRSNLFCPLSLSRVTASAVAAWFAPLAQFAGPPHGTEWPFAERDRMARRDRARADAEKTFRSPAFA